MAYTTCPGCSGALAPELNHKTLRLCDATRLSECTGCGGLVGVVDERDLSAFVILEFDETPSGQTVAERRRVEEEARYFDLEIFNTFRTPKTRRVHGWYNPRTKRVVQFG